MQRQGILWATCLALIIPFSTSWAQDVDYSKLERLKGDALLAEYSGVTRYGTYGGPTNKSDDGVFVEIHDENGRTDYSEGIVKQYGEWRIKDDRMCYRYDHEPNLENCFYEFKLGECIFEYLHVTPDGKAPMFPTYWNSRTVADPKIKSCDALQIS